ncbi:hypothetical protein C7E18_23270, partial [Stenotrophomonas maltophilia]
IDTGQPRRLQLDSRRCPTRMPDDFPAPLPDASYTQANLRPAYTRCVDASIDTGQPRRLQLDSRRCPTRMPDDFPAPLPDAS